MFGRSTSMYIDFDRRQHESFNSQMSRDCFLQQNSLFLMIIIIDFFTDMETGRDEVCITPYEIVGSWKDMNTRKQKKKISLIYCYRYYSLISQFGIYLVPKAVT